MQSAKSRTAHVRALSTIIVALASLFGGAIPSLAASLVPVNVDEAKIVRMPGRTATIILGNPLVADISLQSGGIMVVTGKSYGDTNLIALDATGAILAEQTIQVRGQPEGMLVVYRGTARETYSCKPNCEQQIMLGDSDAAFARVLGQTSARVQAAQALAAPVPNIRGTPARP